MNDENNNKFLISSEEKIKKEKPIEFKDNNDITTKIPLCIINETNNLEENSPNKDLEIASLTVNSIKNNNNPIKFFNLKNKNIQTKVSASYKNHFSPIKNGNFFNRNIIKDNLSPRSNFSNFKQNIKNYMSPKNNINFSKENLDKKLKNSINLTNEKSYKNFQSEIFSNLKVLNSSKIKGLKISDIKPGNKIKNNLKKIKNIRTMNSSPAAYTPSTQTSINKFNLITTKCNLKTSYNSENKFTKLDKSLNSPRFMNAKKGFKNFSYEKSFNKNLHNNSLRITPYLSSYNNQEIENINNERNLISPISFFSYNDSNTSFQLKKINFNNNKITSKIKNNSRVKNIQVINNFKKNSYNCLNIKEETSNYNNISNKKNKIINITTQKIKENSKSKNLKMNPNKELNKYQNLNTCQEFSSSRMKLNLSNNKNTFQNSKNIYIRKNYNNYRDQTQAERKELNYVKYLENNTANSISEIPNIGKIYRDNMGSDYVKFKTAKNEINCNVNNNKNLTNTYNINSSNYYSPYFSTKNKNTKVNNFTFRKLSSSLNINNSREISTNLKDTNILSSRNHNIEYDLLKAKIPVKESLKLNKKEQNLKIENNINNKYNFKNFQKSRNAFSANKTHKIIFNSSELTKSKNSLVNSKKNFKFINTAENRNFNSNLISKINSNEISANSPLNKNIEIADKIVLNEFTKTEETMNYLNNLDMYKSFKEGYKNTKLKIFTPREKMNLNSTVSSNHLSPLELQNSVKNSETSSLKESSKFKSNVKIDDFYQSNNLYNNEIDDKYSNYLISRFSHLDFGKIIEEDTKSINNNNSKEQSNDLNSVNLRKNNFLNYRLTYLINDNNTNIKSNINNRYFSADDIPKDSNEFIRNRYKGILDCY